MYASKSKINQISQNSHKKEYYLPRLVGVVIFNLNNGFLILSTFEEKLVKYYTWTKFFYLGHIIFTKIRTYGKDTQMRLKIESNNSFKT